MMGVTRVTMTELDVLREIRWCVDDAITNIERAAELGARAVAYDASPETHDLWEQAERRRLPTVEMLRVAEAARLKELAEIPARHGKRKARRG